MNFQTFAPSRHLQPYIKQYYLVNGDFGQKTEDVFFADGCMEMVFNLDLDFYRGKEKEHWAKVIGQITDPLHVKATGRGKSFGVWFTPQGFSKFSNIPAQEFNNRAVPLDEVFDGEFLQAVGLHLSYNRLKDVIMTLNSYFEKRLTQSSAGRKELIIDHAIQDLKQDNNETSISQLARSFNISERYVQQIFLEKVGLSPKKFQRIMRFQNSLDQINSTSSTSLTAVAYSKGYFDQSHFIREFKAFTGHTPSQYQTIQHPINQYFLNQ